MQTKTRRIPFLSTGTKLAVLGTLLAVGMPAQAAPENYTVDSRHTFPVFEVGHLGFSLQRGRFNQSSGKISLDREARTGSVELTIDAASIDMGIDKWDTHMKGEDFFNVQKYPTITYKSTKMLFDGDKVVGAEGDLTLLGVTKPVKVTLTDFACGANPYNKKPLCGGNATVQIKRSEFGMTYGLPNFTDNVKIMIPVEAFKD
ncbi:MAG: YceI family protein [Burkholderiales bacterium]